MKTILLGVTGSIAAYKACELVRTFRKKGYNVQCAMSADADRFITPLTLETLSSRKVARDMFRLPERRAPRHISLADDADLILIAPATADVIAKVAAGICDDILTCTVCAKDSPVMFAPAMNDRMYNNPVIQDKISYLKQKGFHFVHPVEGDLACNRKGEGHLAPLDRIVMRAEEVLAQ